MCITPLFLKTTWHTYRSVPCGKCALCLKKRRIEWFARLNEHFKVSEATIFLTLTYETPPEKGVNKEDVQLWLKKFRHYIPRKISYYLVAEYGTKTKRPHYHALLFNVYRSEIHFIEKTWENGFIHVGQINQKSIMYVTKYHSNKDSKNNPPGCNKEFTLCSKGLGLSYIEKTKEWHSGKLERFYYPYYDKKTALPRYYKEKLYTKKERSFIFELASSGNSLKQQAYEYGEAYDDHENAIQTILDRYKNFQRNFKQKSNINDKF